MLSFLKKIIDFFLFGNLFISVCACALIYSSGVQANFRISVNYYVLTFFSTLFIYNFQRIFYKRQAEYSIQLIRRVWVSKNQFALKILTLIGVIGVLVMLLFIDIKIVFYLSPLLLLSLFYFLPQIKLRKNAWVKLIVLAGVWTIVTSVVPVLLMNKGVIENIFFLHIATRFCFMVAICIPFDIRDVEVDRNENVFTLPVLYGELKSKMIAIAFMLLYMLLIFLEYFSGVFEMKIFIALLISAIVNAVLVVMTNSKRSEYFYSVLLDGTMIVQGLVLLLLRI